MEEREHSATHEDHEKMTNPVTDNDSDPQALSTDVGGVCVCIPLILIHIVCRNPAKRTQSIISMKYGLLMLMVNLVIRETLITSADMVQPIIF